MGYFFRLTAMVLLYAPSHRQDGTYHGLYYTSRGALAGMRNSSMGPPHEGSIRRPIAPWVNAPPLSYVPLLWTKEMFYLMMHSTHFIYGYMASDILWRTTQIVREETCCRHMEYSFWVLLYAPSHRQDSTYHDLCYTSRGALAGTRNSSMCCKLPIFTLLFIYLLSVFLYYFCSTLKWHLHFSPCQTIQIVRWDWVGLFSKQRRKC